MRALGLTVYRRLMIFERQPDSKPDPDSRRRLLIGRLGPGEIEAYRLLRPDTPTAEIERRLAAGQDCVVGWRDGRIVAARWLATNRADFSYLGLSFVLLPRVAYTFDVFTSPEARGEGLAAALRPACDAIMVERGTTIALGSSLAENAAGRGLNRAAGSTPVGTIGCLRAGPARIPLVRIPPGYVGKASTLRLSYSLARLP